MRVVAGGRFSLRVLSVGASLALAIGVGATLAPAALQRAADEVHGSVETASGQGVSGLPVEADCPPHNGGTQKTTTDGAGSFSFDLPSPSDCRIILNPGTGTYVGGNPHFDGYYLPSSEGGWSCAFGGCRGGKFIAVLAVPPSNALSVTEVTPGTSPFTVDVRVRLKDKWTDASGCDTGAAYTFSDPELASAAAMGPCTYELTFRAPGTGIYHAALKATDRSGAVIPMSVDQYGTKVDGQFTLIIDSCSKPEEDVPDVDALLNRNDGTCDVMVGGWDSDATDVAAKVVAATESSPGLAIAPIPIESVDPSDWAGRGLSGDANTGWLPTGTRQPAQAGEERYTLPTGVGDAVALVRQAFIPGLPESFDGAGHIPAKTRLSDHPPATVISAHGWWYTPNGLVRVPAGDQIRTYVPLGTSMSNDLGIDVDTGHLHGEDTKYLYTYTAGQLMPDFTFAHYPGPTGTHGVHPTNPTTLNNLITPDEGQVWISACAEIEIPTGETPDQALSKLPIHTPGSDAPDGYANSTITANGHLQTAVASASP